MNIALRLALIFVVAWGGICQSQGQARLRQPNLQRQSWLELPGGATLAFDGGDFTLTYTTSYVSPPSTSGRPVRWDVSRVRGAAAVLVQVSRSAFPPDGNPSPEGNLLFVTRLDGAKGVYTVDVGALATQTGYEPPKPRRLTREAQRNPREAGISSFMARGGLFAVFVRVVPIQSLTEAAPVGLASQPLRIIYGNPPPPDFVFEKWHPKPEAKPPIECVGMSYSPADHRCVVHPSKDVCAKAGKSKPWYDKVVSSFVDAWNFVAKAYSAIKSKVVDVVASAFPIVPRVVFEYAMDSALAACGLPPNIPNVDALMSQGADYLAGEIVAQVGPPIASDLAQSQLKSAILKGASQAGKAVGQAGPDTLCEYTIDMPYLVVRVRNTSDKPLGDIRFNAFDDTSLFKGYSLTIQNLKPGKILPLVIPLLPNMFHGKYIVGGVVKDAIWWQDYNTVPARVTVYASDKPYSAGQPFGAGTGPRLFNVPFAIGQ